MRIYAAPPPSYDLGIALQGTFDPETKNFGYNVLVANGTSDKPDYTPYKWFYGDVWAYFAHKHVVVDFLCGLPETELVSYMEAFTPDA
ncbi:MAG: hypothetical protein WDM78_19930 [Puia sp.]